MSTTKDEQQTPKKNVNGKGGKGNQEFYESFETEIRPPDGGYGWVIVACSFYFTMLVEGVINSFGVYVSELVNEFKETEGKTAWLGSILSGCTMSVGPLASLLTNKYGCRITCITGCILTATSLVVSVFCPTITWLMIIYCFGGIGLGFVILPALVIPGYYFESRRALASGIGMTGTGFGTCIFPPVVNYIVMNKGWRAANLFLAGVTLTGAVCGILLRPLKATIIPKQTSNGFQLTPTFSRLMNNEQSNSTIDVSFSNKAEYKLYKQKNNQAVTMKNQPCSRDRSHSNVTEYFPCGQISTQTLSNREILYSGSGMQLDFLKRDSIQDEKENLKVLLDFGLLKDMKFVLFALMSIFVMIAYYIPFLFVFEDAKTNGMEPTKASLLLSVAGIVFTVSQLCLGYMVNFPRVDVLLVNNICLVIGTISVGLIPVCSSYTSYMSAIVFFGIAIAGHITFAPIMVVDLLGVEKLSNGLGIVQLFRGLAVFLGCPMAGVLVDLTHSFKIAFFVSAGLFLIAALLGFIVLFMKRKRCCFT